MCGRRISPISFIKISSLLVQVLARALSMHGLPSSARSPLGSSVSRHLMLPIGGCCESRGPRITMSGDQPHSYPGPYTTNAASSVQDKAASVLCIRFPWHRPAYGTQCHSQPLYSRCSCKRFLLCNAPGLIFVYVDKLTIASPSSRSSVRRYHDDFSFSLNLSPCSRTK